MSDIEHVDHDASLIDRLKVVENVGLYSIKGYSKHEIAGLMGLSVKEVGDCVTEYKKILNRQAESDPYFLERIQFNTIKALEEFDEISKEAWETVEIATSQGMIAQRIAALKLTTDIATKKAQLHKLMQQNTSADGEYIQRMQRAENVNHILSKILRDVVAKHPQIASEVRQELALAFELMGEDDNYPDRNVMDGEVVNDGG